MNYRLIPRMVKRRLADDSNRSSRTKMRVGNL
jgi:hypothetical protein